MRQQKLQLEINVATKSDSMFSAFSALWKGQTNLQKLCIIFGSLTLYLWWLIQNKNLSLCSTETYEKTRSDTSCGQMVFMLCGYIISIISNWKTFPELMQTQYGICCQPGRTGKGVLTPQDTNLDSSLSTSRAWS